MKVSMTDAKAQLTELVRRAEAGDEVILTRHGQPTVQLVPLKPRNADRASRRWILERFRAHARRKITPGVSAARSQDFLYDERGLPK
jgi:prevent-host-death family protein